jgi:hypothetical protein
MMNVVGPFSKDYVVFLNCYMAPVSNKILTYSPFVSALVGLTYDAQLSSQDPL